jgi:hypothetical protein
LNPKNIFFIVIFYVKKGEDNYYKVPFEPRAFLKVAELFFSDYTGLIAEINTTDYL